LDDPAKKDFYNELQCLDKKMRAATKVEVPRDLAHKLILRQTMQTHRAKKSRNLIQLAMAASIAFVAGVSFTLWQQSNLLDISKQAIAHVYHEGDYALGASENLSLQQVNAKLATFGGELTEDIGRVYYANFCDFEDVRSLHMVVEGAQGRVTVFVIPHDDKHLVDGISRDTRFNSQAMDFQKASIIVVGEEGENMSEMKQKLIQKIQFSA
jgi:hypothetical protein